MSYYNYIILYHVYLQFYLDNGKSAIIDTLISSFGNKKSVCIVLISPIGFVLYV